jgi:phytoene/squalene synthetase
MIAEMRLQWWLDTINEIYEGKVRHHEVVAPLAEVIAAYDLPQALFVELIEARRFDIYRIGHTGMPAFDAYINATSGNLMRLAAISLGAEDLLCTKDFGFAVGVANLWRALPALYAAGRHPVPVDCALERNAVAGGEVPDNLSAVLHSISGNALSKAQSARRARNILPKSASPALLAGWQVNVPLTMVKAQPRNALRQPLETSEFQKKLGLLWRSSTGRW